MVRRNLDNIEIIEPPLNELVKKHSYKRTCFTGCGCLLILIIATIIGIRLYIGPGPENLKNLPPNFPADIPIYDRDAIESMIFISGKYKNRGVEIAAFFPKIILSPLLLKTGDNKTISPENGWQELWKIITQPVGDHRDTIQIHWRTLNAEPNFIISYYRKELLKKNFQINVQPEGNKVQQFYFDRTDGISGSLYVQSGDNTVGTDYAMLTVSLPSSN